MQLAPFARQLDCRFTRLAAGIEQVHLVAAGAAAQPLGQVQLAAIEQPRARVDQRLRLGRHRLDQCRGAMAEAVGASALGKVQVGAVGAVPQPGTLAADENLRGSLNTRHQALTGQVVAPCG